MVAGLRRLAVLAGLISPGRVLLAGRGVVFVTLRRLGLGISLAFAVGSASLAAVAAPVRILRAAAPGGFLLAGGSGRLASSRGGILL